MSPEQRVELDALLDKPCIPSKMDRRGVIQACAAFMGTLHSPGWGEVDVYLMQDRRPVFVIRQNGNLDTIVESLTGV